MTDELQLLAQKRGRLLERIANQRALLRVQIIPVQKTAGRADRAVVVAQGTWQYLRAHRAGIALIAGVAGSVFVILRPGRTFRLLRRGFVL